MATQSNMPSPAKASTPAPRPLATKALVDVQVDPEKEALNQKLRDIGVALIQPDQIPPDWPVDFFDESMNYGSTAHMTQAQKSEEFRRRALYSHLRVAAYKKVLEAQIGRTKVGIRWGLVFSLACLVTMGLWHYKDIGQIGESMKGAGAAIATMKEAIPGVSAAPMSLEDQQRAALAKMLGQ